MKAYTLLILAGIIIIVSGIVFHFQGYGIIGPSSSFMYTNPEWITYGLEIVLLGAIILGAGIILNLKSR